MLKTLIRFFSVNLFITLFNVALNFTGAKFLSREIFGEIILIQSIFMICVNVSLLGSNYELVRFGNLKKYLDKTFYLSSNNLLVSLLICFGFSIILQHFLLSKISLWLTLSSLGMMMYMLYASFLRSIQSIFRSSFYEKTIVIVSSIVISSLLIEDLKIENFEFVYFLGIIGLLFGLVKLKLFLNIFSPFGQNTSPGTRGIRNQFYLSTILTLSFTQADKLFLAERLDVEQVAIWAVYLQGLTPFMFFGRIVFQYFLPEFSNERLKISKEILFKYIVVCLLGASLAFPILFFGLDYFYMGKYNIDPFIMAIVCLIGALNVIYQLISSNFLSKVSSSELKQFNIINIVLSLSLFTVFSFLNKENYLLILSTSLLCFWILKILSLNYLIKYDIRSNYLS